MDLARFLESQQVAHGDVQPGNVMVGSGGRTIQLIDYDGMYVDELKPLGSAELGLRNFQHPQRSSTSWNSSLDRFSFILLNLALRALQLKPVSGTAVRRTRRASYSGRTTSSNLVSLRSSGN